MMDIKQIKRRFKVFTSMESESGGMASSLINDILSVFESHKQQAEQIARLKDLLEDAIGSIDLHVPQARMERRRIEKEFESIKALNGQKGGK